MSSTYTRQEALESLYRITFAEAPETPRYTKAKEYIKSTLSSKGVPEEVIKFLDEETSSGFSQCFLSRLKDKKFMRTLRSLESGTKLPNEVVVKAVNSLITHAIIDIELGNTSRQVVVNNLQIDKLMNIVQYYFNTGSLPDSTYETIRNLLDS
ncbi:hypothetical protein SP15_028 [Bacillus phage SP-15]|uniref:Uncharacterized protein n=1 Tax=Bacillus phage SP-15 TaxID=1792032 RepID=A0A127AW74_9CAUD|nr:hypothetical protein SP15_028 [Bacillus phage SP-15]AMM44827.1 hypothetical protein SP15_028 [Bacillus phage SP-15]